jgi:hypothetical protein
MQFRSPTSEPIRLALLSGHIAVIGQDWRELPEIFHSHAVKAGAERNDGKGPPPIMRPVRAGEDAIRGSIDYDTAYRDALKTMVTRSAAGDFTGASQPNIKVVSKLVGFSANREEVYRVFKAMKAEAENSPA